MPRKRPSAKYSLAKAAPLLGCTKQNLSRAVKTGRLVRSIVRDERGQPKIADLELARRELAASTDLSKAPGYVKARATGGEGAPPPEGLEAPLDLNLAYETARKMYWQAGESELKVRTRAGELVEAKKITERVFGVFTRLRTKLLGLPTRAKQQLPHLSTKDVAMVDSLIREALEELSLEVSAEADQEETVGG